MRRSTLMPSRPNPWGRAAVSFPMLAAGGGGHQPSTGHRDCPIRALSVSLSVKFAPKKPQKSCLCDCPSGRCGSPLGVLPKVQSPAERLRPDNFSRMPPISTFDACGDYHSSVVCWKTAGMRPFPRGGSARDHPRLVLRTSCRCSARAREVLFAHWANDAIVVAPLQQGPPAGN
jgi:hypothetical protein